MSAVWSLKRLEAKQDGPMRHQPRVLALLLIRSAFGLFAQALVAAPAAGQPAPVAGGQQPPLMQRDEEIALALSACPPFVASKAAVYVLDRTGYVKARDGQNGFTAIVQHSLPTSQEPQCMDAEGARTFLPRMLRVAELRAQGKPEAEIQAIVADAVAKGAIPTPQRPGVIYMLSKENIQPTFPPHVMFYGTHLANADLGVDGRDLGPDGNPTAPTFVAGDGPYALVIVPLGPHGSEVPHDKRD